MKFNIIIAFFIFSFLNIQGQNQKIKVTNTCENFSFNFDKPENWVLDSKNAAQYLAYSAIYKSKADLDNGGALIQIYAFKKQDENTIEDLNYDINQYQGKYENLKQKDLIINHSSYKTYCKEVYVDKLFYQYIVYLNPGKEFNFGISIALNINKSELKFEDLKIFENLVKSIKALK